MSESLVVGDEAKVGEGDIGDGGEEIVFEADDDMTVLVDTDELSTDIVETTAGDNDRSGTLACHIVWLQVDDVLLIALYRIHEVGHLLLRDVDDLVHIVVDSLPTEDETGIADRREIVGGINDLRTDLLDEALDENHIGEGGLKPAMFLALLTDILVGHRHEGLYAGMLEGLLGLQDPGDAGEIKAQGIPLTLKTVCHHRKSHATGCARDIF